MTAPSIWVQRFQPMIRTGGPVLDVASGNGRHARYLVSQGHEVTAVDRDISALSDIRDSRLTSIQADLEIGGARPFGDRRFAAVVVTNYLFRPLFDPIMRALEPSGILIYETFAQGNERFGHPRNPNFLLQPGELLDVASRGDLRVIAYEDLEVAEPRRARVQRLCAVSSPYSAAS